MTDRALTEIARDNTSLSLAISTGLVGLVETVETLTENAQSPATIRAYRSDWGHFTAWCATHQLCPLPAAPETVALYLAELAGVKTAATIRRRLSTISQAHQRIGHDTPTATALVRQTLKGIFRTFGTAAAGKAPARTELIRTMVGTLDLERLIGVRDRALLVMGFAGAFRRSEIVALDVPDITQVAEGLAVDIRWSKTDQEGEGLKVGLPYGSDQLTCPVRAFQAWLEASGIPSGPIFRPVTKGGALGLRRLSANAVADVVKRTAQRAGIDPDDLAAHSLRVGLITSAAEAGVLERDIMRHSRHNSIPVMRRYIRDATLFQDNAAARVGL